MLNGILLDCYHNYPILERPIHFLEKVLDVTLRWTEWPEEFCKDNYLVVKPNYVYEHVDSIVSSKY